MIRVAHDLLCVDFRAFAVDTWPGVSQNCVVPLERRECIVGARYTGDAPTNLRIQFYESASPLRPTLGRALFSEPVEPEFFRANETQWCPLATMRPTVLVITRAQEPIAGGCLYLLTDRSST